MLPRTLRRRGPWAWLALPLPWLCWRLLPPRAARQDAALRVPDLRDFARGSAPAVPGRPRNFRRWLGLLAWLLLVGASANPRWLGAKSSGFTMVLHTWNQRLHFHPHIHCIVPGAGIAATGEVVKVKNANFLVPQPVLRKIFRGRFRDGLAALEEHQSREAKPFTLTAIDPSVWTQDWGVHLQPFGSGENIIKYLGRYVCRTAIGDSRIVSMTDTHVSFHWKDRANGNAPRVETIEGMEFVKRYLRHVLPRGMREVRYFGFCHPAAKAKRERIAFHTGRPLLIGPALVAPEKPPHVVSCPCCGEPMKKLLRLLPAWSQGRAPPPLKKRSCA